MSSKRKVQEIVSMLTSNPGVLVVEEIATANLQHQQHLSQQTKRTPPLSRLLRQSTWHFLGLHLDQLSHSTQFH